ncbi:MAG: hypothetical protein ACYCSG_07175 [Thermoplasmataceae archaeon]
MQRSPFDQSAAKDFSARLSSMFQEAVSVPDTSRVVLSYNLAIHLLPKVKSSFCSGDCKNNRK